jgi:alpha-tubulin suppressor-like RCC1 family protein
LSQGHSTNVSTPTAIPIFQHRGIKQACGGFSHSIFLTVDGAVWACGTNSTAQLGLLDVQHTHVAQQIDSAHLNNASVILIGSGAHHSLFYTERHELFSTGCNSNGELGLGHIDTVNHPQLVALPFNDEIITDIQCGYQHTILLTNTGSVYSCGLNSSHELGLSRNMESSVSVFTKVDLSHVQMVRCGFYVSAYCCYCAVVNIVLMKK